MGCWVVPTRFFPSANLCEWLRFSKVPTLVSIFMPLSTMKQTIWQSHTIANVSWAHVQMVDLISDWTQIFLHSSPATETNCSLLQLSSKYLVYKCLKMSIKYQWTSKTSDGWKLRGLLCCSGRWWSRILGILVQTYSFFKSQNLLWRVSNPKQYWQEHYCMNNLTCVEHIE